MSALTLNRFLKKLCFGASGMSRGRNRSPSISLRLSLHQPTHGGVHSAAEIKTSCCSNASNRPHSPGCVLLAVPSGSEDSTSPLFKGCWACIPQMYPFQWIIKTPDDICIPNLPYRVFGSKLTAVGCPRLLA